METEDKTGECNWKVEVEKGKKVEVEKVERRGNMATEQETGKGENDWQLKKNTGDLNGRKKGGRNSRLTQPNKRKERCNRRVYKRL